MQFLLVLCNKGVADAVSNILLLRSFSNHIYYMYMLVYISVTCGSGCQNGGICVDQDECKCARGFTGSHCEEGECEKNIWKIPISSYQLLSAHAYIIF